MGFFTAPHPTSLVRRCDRSNHRGYCGSYWATAVLCAEEKGKIIPKRFRDDQNTEWEEVEGQPSAINLRSGTFALVRKVEKPRLSPMEEWVVSNTNRMSPFESEYRIGWSVGVWEGARKMLEATGEVFYLYAPGEWERRKGFDEGVRAVQKRAREFVGEKDK